VTSGSKELSGPWIGIRPYQATLDHANLFFGRASESRKLMDNAQSARLTLLYGKSGVGKSSLLNTGLIHPCRARAIYEYKEFGSAEASVVAFRSWQSDPTTKLPSAIARLVSAQCGTELDVSDDLQATLQAATEVLRGTLILVLDQFEEYFQYFSSYRDSSGPQAFENRLISVLNSRDVPIHVVVSIREDALAWLDRFKGRVPNLFENYLRIQHLSPQGAHDVIMRPLQVYREQYPEACGPSTAEPGLADTIIAQILESEGISDGDQYDRGRLPAPFLQMVMSRLWQLSSDRGYQSITLGILDELGGAAKIYRGFVESTLRETLDPPMLQAAGEMFQFLVTPSGRKIFQTAPDLARSTGLPPDVVARTIERLQEQRILIPVPAPRGEVGFEFAHDVLAQSARKWFEEYEFQRRIDAEKERAEESQRQADRQKAVSRRLTVLTLALASLLLAAIGAVIFAEYQRRAAVRSEILGRSRELALYADRQLPSDAQLALLLAREAALSTKRLDGTILPEVRETLRLAVATAAVEGSFNVQEDAQWNGRTLVASKYSPPDETNSRIDVTDLRTGRVTPLPIHDFIYDFAWHPTDDLLLITVNDQLLSWHPLETGQPEIRRLSAPLGMAFKRDGSEIALANNGLSVLSYPTWKELLRVSDRETTFDPSWSPDSSLIAYYSFTKLFVRKAPPDGGLVFKREGRVSRLLWNARSSQLAAQGFNDGRLLIFDQPGWREHELSSPSGPVSGYSWAPRSNELVVFYTDRSAAIYNIDTEKRVYNFYTSGVTGSSATWSPDEQKLGVVAGRKFLIYNLESRRAKTDEDLLRLADKWRRRWFAPSECVAFLHVQTCPSEK
jgi:hypothetical protein